MLTIVIRIFLYSLILSISAGFVFLDSTQLQSAEDSYTEMAQEAMLFLIAIIGWFYSRKTDQYKTFILFLVAFSSVFFIREFNNYLSDNFFKGAWQVGVLIILIPSIIYFYKKRVLLKSDVLALKETAPFGIIMLGGILLIVFSRIYGNKHIWMNFMGDNYLRMIKEVSEESIELMAYTVIFIGFIELLFLSKRIQNKS
tara:strand:+ start:835 stop:1431 length:597 start_codon:yes stop_codon:yes gene_type:complete